jgi:hypothetical protein
VKFKAGTTYRIVETTDGLFVVERSTWSVSWFHVRRGWSFCNSRGNVLSPHGSWMALAWFVPKFYPSLKSAKDAARRFCRGDVVHEVIIGTNSETHR